MRSTVASQNKKIKKKIDRFLWIYCKQMLNTLNHNKYNKHSKFQTNWNELISYKVLHEGIIMVRKYFQKYWLQWDIMF